MNKILLKILKFVLYLIPLLLGIWGFYMVEGIGFLDSLFTAILLYLFNYADTPPNIYIEIARWGAAAVTASWLVTIFYTLRDKVMNFLLYCTGKSIAVYGLDEEKNFVMKEMKPYAVDGKDKFVSASKYILLNDEDTNFAFYNTNKAKLKRTPVYIKCDSMRSGEVCDSQLHLFCPEETSARLFWNENIIYPLSVEKNHQLDIVFMGFEKLGEELILFGLQSNIFSPEQKINYHILGDGSRFMALHTELTSISDTIRFYNEPWFAQMELIERADMVIVLTQENQSELLRDILFGTKRDRIHVFVSDADKVQLLNENERLLVFDWKTKSQKLEYILKDTLFLRAKKINLRYEHIYSNVEETEENMEKTWQKLNAFTRYSNVNSADYHEIRLKMIEFMGKASIHELSSEEFELFSELEHIRWCRYHYLNNWKYGVPENGKNKDAILRIHKDLIPYQDLSEGEKEKDRENLRILHSI